MSLKTTSEGMVKIDIDGLDNIRHPPPKVTFRRGNFNMPDAYKILEKHLPTKDDFTGVLREFEELQGVWQYYRPSVDKFTLCSPTVNNEGDLLFELRRAPAPAPKFTRPATRPIWLKSTSRLPSSASITVPVGNGGANGSAASPTLPTGVKSPVTGTNGHGAHGSIPTPTTPTTTSPSTFTGTKPLIPGAIAVKGATPASSNGSGTNGTNGTHANGNNG